MKARHLEILQEKGFPVPKFILISENEEADLSFSERDCFARRRYRRSLPPTPEVWNIKKRRIEGRKNTVPQKGRKENRRKKNSRRKRNRKN